MAPKFVVDKIIREHFKTFSDSHGKPRPTDWIEMLGVPVVLGAVAAGFEVELHDLADVVVGVSILAGLLFGLLIYVFQLRLQLASDPRVNPRGRTIELVEQLFSNVAYAVVLGLTTTAYLVACANIAHPFEAGGPDQINRWWSAGVVTLGAHLLLTIFMCLKRTRTAFDNLINERAGVPVQDMSSSESDSPTVRAPR